MNHTQTFKPHSQAANTRQAIWGILQKRPAEDILLSELATLATAEYPKAYAAAKHLVRKGFAERVTMFVPAPTKKNPDKKRKATGLRGIPAWAPSKQGSW